MKIAHIINPVKVDFSESEESKKSYLYVAQPVTFNSMLNAKKHAKENVEIELYTTQFREDREIIPSGFSITEDLEKDIHDYVDLPVRSRKLPRIKDILYKLYENSNAEYFIYTNVDIGLYENFYNRIEEIITQGYDGFCINRRVLPTFLGGIRLDKKNMDLIYKLKGTSHMGSDCFVFKRDMVPRFKFRNLFVGFAPIGKCIKHQTKINSKKYKHFTEEFVTFHLGDETSWTKRCDMFNSHYLKANLAEGKASSPSVIKGKGPHGAFRKKIRIQNKWKK